MANRLAAILYLLTAVATLIVGVASFSLVEAVISAANRAWLPAFAVTDFITPSIFLLAGVSASWKHSESKAIRWVAAAVVLIVLGPTMRRIGLGWRPIAQATGVLISAPVFILGSLVKTSASIAAVGVISYALLQGYALFLGLQNYWLLGGALQRLLTLLFPPTLVLFSLAVAIASYRKSHASA